MTGPEKNKDLVPKGEGDISPFFRPFPFSPFYDFDNYVSEIMHRHSSWYDQEFNKTLNQFDSFFKDPFDESRIDNSFLNKRRVPMDLKEFSVLRPNFFPSSFFGPSFSSLFSSRFSSPFSTLLSRVHDGCSNMNMVDKGKKIEITLKAPGLSKDDLEIDVDNDRLNIKGMRTDEFQETGENGFYHFKEKKMSCFQQSILLPENADPDKVRATLKDGILKIDIDKLDQPEKKKVQIE